MTILKKTPNRQVRHLMAERIAAMDWTANIGELKMGQPDLWKHRSKSMSCSTCMWYAEKEAKNPQIAREDDKVVGRCRRRTPTMNGYPVVYEGDWCGDHKLDENKI